MLSSEAAAASATKKKNINACDYIISIYMIMPLQKRSLEYTAFYHTWKILMHVPS